MMIAGIKGKDVREARDHEDSLTSAVFGHLRYLPPDVFWPTLFTKAHDATQDERTLTDALKENGLSLEQCAKLEIEFWPYHKAIGEPDMILKFRDDAGRPLLTIVVEVKFHAEQSGDQLARYMELVTKPPNGIRPEYVCLIYLTPRESLNEINETIKSDQRLKQFRDKMFRLQWQDVLEVAAAKKHGGNCFLYDTILTDVATLLRKRGLEHFKGMQHIEDLELFKIKPPFRIFNEMNEINALEMFAIEKGEWNQ